MATRRGVASDWQVPEKGPAKCKVGGRVVGVWAKSYDEPNPAYEVLRAAVEAGQTVEVEGREEQRAGPKGPYTSFTADEVRVVAAEAGTRDGDGRVFVGREPGTADFWVAARWAYGLAYEIEAHNIGSLAVTVDQVSKTASELLRRSHADGLEYRESVAAPKSEETQDAGES